MRDVFGPHPKLLHETSKWGGEVRSGGVRGREGKEGGGGEGRGEEEFISLSAPLPSQRTPTHFLHTLLRRRSLFRHVHSRTRTHTHLCARSRYQMKEHLHQRQDCGSLCVCVCVRDKSITQRAAASNSPSSCQRRAGPHTHTHTLVATLSRVT